MKLAIVAAVLIAYWLSARFVSSAIEALGRKESASAYRIKYITKTVHLALVLVYAVILATLLGIEYSQVSFFLSSVLAVMGVVLFAQWSILSNLTASLIIFFGFPYRVGDKIKILDKDDDISGIIEEITLFHVLIKRGEELITYPNSLILQKAVVKNPAKPAAVAVPASDTKPEA